MDDVSAYEAVYGQKMDHEFSCSKEVVCQFWIVPDWLKVTKDPEFNDYACEHYILDGVEIDDDDANGYFSDGSLPSDEKDKVFNEYFFNHQKDENSNKDHGESDNVAVELDHDVFSESGIASPEQNVTA
jgi:hypothetical protein